MYELKVENGTYKANSLFALMMTVFLHRLHHFLKDGKWID